MDITKLKISIDDGHYSVEIVMPFCSFIFCDLLIIPKSWEELKSIGAGGEEGNSFTSWYYREEENILLVNNRASGNDTESEISFTFDTIKNKDYLDVLFQASNFNEAGLGISDFIIPDTLIVSKEGEDFIEFEKK